MDINGSTAERVRQFHTPLSYSDEFYYENYYHAMVQCNGALYIIGRLEAHLGFKLIQSDGTAAGTKILTDTHVYTLGSNPRDFVSVNGLVFFRTFPDPYNYAWPSEDDYEGVDLYRTDGTEAGTFRMPGWFQEWNEMEPVGNALFYTAENGGWELNKTDGTNTTTITIGSTGEGRPTNLTAVGNTLYYTNAFAQLWKTDGTSQGTVMMKDFFSIKSITNVEGKAFILAETSAGGLELWRTNASGAVVRIKTIRTSAAIHAMYNPTTTRGHILYFVANDGIHGNEIWETDGTSSGTFMLRDLSPHDPANNYDGEGDIRSMVYTNGSLIVNALDQDALWAIHTYSTSSKMWRTTRVGDEAASPLIAVNNKAFFVSDRKLFAVDGSATLVHLTDIGAYEQLAYAVIGNHLYISSAPYTHELWRTDGTECGTIQIQTGIGSAFQIAAIGNDLIMGASEPFIYRNIESIGTPCGPVAFASIQETEIVMTPYPNPFTNNFTLRVHGEENEIAEVAVFSDSGIPIENLGAVKINVDHPDIGAAWPNGMYYVKVNRGGKLTTHTVVKK
jgi:ELWxxDGT repeat protein